MVGVHIFVGLITENTDKHVEPINIDLGEKCWIGMNSVILPRAELSPHATVGADAVVIKSFPRLLCYCS